MSVISLTPNLTHLKNPFEADKQHFPTPLQEFQFYDKYSRWNWDEMRRETWAETVDRAVLYMRNLSSDRLAPSEYEEIRSAILNMEVMPSMRLISMAGQAAERNSLAIYNCSALPVQDIDSFVEAMLISMAGCGVGFSVESQWVNMLPRIAPQTGIQHLTHTVEDSTDGWGNALRLGLANWFAGRDIDFDLSALRAKGAILRIKGGRSSGPEVLGVLLHNLRRIILSRQGQYLRPIDAHDMMCFVGDAAVSGGLRRTAMISIFDWDDEEMLHAKDPAALLQNPQRWNANNSAVWPKGITRADVERQMRSMDAAGSGEPGIFSREAAHATLPNRRSPAQFMPNPCVTGDTWVMTTEGARQVDDLIGTPFTALVDGKPYESRTGFLHTGDKETLTLILRSGHTLRLTKNHKVMTTNGWVEAQSLTTASQVVLHDHEGAEWGGPGSLDAGYALGHLVGDGTFDPKGSAILQVWGKDTGSLAPKARLELFANTLGDSAWRRIEKIDSWRLCSMPLARFALGFGIKRGSKTVTREVELSSSDFYRGFIRGLFDTDGHVEGKSTGGGVSIRLSSSNQQTLFGVQRMLGRLGVRSVVRKMHPAGRDCLGYEAGASWRLIISGAHCERYMSAVGFTDESKREKWETAASAMTRSFYGKPNVSSVEHIVVGSVEKVYDASVNEVHAFDANGLYVHNCGEIFLRPFGLCNLSSVIARADDTTESLTRKARIATNIGTIQSLATHFPGLRPEWKKNAEEERLLGVDINGQMDCPLFRNPQVMSRLRDHVINVNRDLSNRLGIAQSASTTCSKPNGNSSTLVDCSPGLHPRHGKYIVRRARVATTSPVYKVLRGCGVPLTPENGQTPMDARTWVVAFPTKAPEGSITRHDLSAIQQCEYWLSVKQNWTEHNPSCTIGYDPDELEDLINWVWEHRQFIGGLSFLPNNQIAYEQAPYEEISQDEYERLSESFPEIDYSLLPIYEREDMTTSSFEVACTAGKCLI